MISPLFFVIVGLIIGLASGAGAIISFNAYKNVQVAAEKERCAPPSPSDPLSTTATADQVESLKREFKKEIEEIKLKTAEEIANVKVAAHLAPDPKKEEPEKS